MSPPFRVRYIGDGEQRDFLIPNATIRKEHIQVVVDGIITKDYVWFNDAVIRLDAAPALGVPITITRTPPVDDPLNTFTEGTVITPEGLRENFRQSLQVSERALWGDRAESAARLDPGATINGVLFTGEDNIEIPSVGLATRALSLSPGAKINNVLFDGTKDIIINLGEFGSSTRTFTVAPGETVDSTITLPIVTHIVSMTASAACWLRVYSLPAAADSDDGRFRFVPPQRGIGVIADPVFTGPQTISWDPTETFINRQTPRSTVYPARITNDSTVGSITITVNFYAL